MNTWFDNNRKLKSCRWLARLVRVSMIALAVQTASAGWKEGGKLPDLKGFGLEGTVPVLTGRVVVVDFWASWCGPCKASFPLLDEIYRQYKTRGVVFLAVNVDEKAENMTKFLEVHPVSFFVVRDATQRLVETAEVDGMPTSFVVDRTGVIRAMHKGFHAGETEAQLVSEIDSLLKAAKGAK